MSNILSLNDALELLEKNNDSLTSFIYYEENGVE